MTHIALILDIVLLAFAFGATTWFFFVQTPVLLTWMGKERFIPIQMKLTKTLFTALSIVISAMFAMTLVHDHAGLWTHVATGGVALFAVLVNTLVVVPRALRAGGRSMAEVRAGEENRSISDFASRGGGEASKVWHRLVVLFVVVMLGGLGAHAAVLLHVAPQSGDHGDHADTHGHHGAHEEVHAAQTTPAERWQADEKTTAHVRAMAADVQRARTSGVDVSAELQSRYENIFKDCTMTGDAHEALHGFLLPLGTHIDELQSADPGARDEVLATIEAHLDGYDRTFR